PKPAVIELGRRLFLDPTVSRLGRHSCAECHDPEHGFSDPRPLSAGDAGPTRRPSQPPTDPPGRPVPRGGGIESVRQILVARIAPPELALAQSRELAGGRIAEAKRRGLDVTETPDVPVSPGAKPVSYGVAATDVTLTPVVDRLNEDGRYA